MLVFSCLRLMAYPYWLSAKQGRIQRGIQTRGIRFQHLLGEICQIQEMILPRHQGDPISNYENLLWKSKVLKSSSYPPITTTSNLACGWAWYSFVVCCWVVLKAALLAKTGIMKAWIQPPFLLWSMIMFSVRNKNAIDYHLQAEHNGIKFGCIGKTLH